MRPCCSTRRVASILSGHQGTPHGLTEVTYAFTSAGNNNGSAFGGLTGNTDWYNTTLGLSMLVGRFFLIVPGAGHRRLAGPQAGRSPPRPAPSRPAPRSSPGLLVGVVLIVVGLTYFPVLALGPDRRAARL